MRSYQKVLAILAIVIPLCQNIHSSTCDSTSLALMEQTWREFRAIHPFGFQTVGLKHYGDTCVFVMSEPAEWVKAEELRDFFSEYDGHLIIGRKSFGYDGGLYDAIGCAKLNPINFKSMERNLFKLLYGTDYKPYYTDLDNPFNHIYYSNYIFDYFVPNFYWYNWRKSEKFIVPSQKDKLVDALSLTKTSKSNELYYSRKRGFLLWIINPKEINSTDTLFRRNSRKFTLDTDLIVHSFLKDQCLYVIGREREIPVTVLPPLRSETIYSIIRDRGNRNSLIINPDSMMIVEDSVSEDSVLVNYATPILMNRSLWNTELGNLMLLTDLMLKSWSENAEIIDLFIDYPLPSSFFTPKGVANEINYKPKYLWRNYNAGSTGSLIPYYMTKSDSIPKRAEEIGNKAHTYFAKLNNTDIVRINQYTFFSQAYLLSPYLSPKTMPSFQGSWIQSPTMTVSNNPWGFGGYLYQVPLGRGVIQGLTARGFRIPSNFHTIMNIPHVRTVIQQEGLAWTRLQQAKKNLAANRNSSVAKREFKNATIAYDKAKLSLTKVLSSNNWHQPLPSPVSAASIMERISSQNNPRNMLINPSLGYIDRGFVPSQHNLAPNQTSNNDLIIDEQIDKSSHSWKERLREKVNNKIHKINTKESKGNFYMIYGYILKFNEDGEYCINYAA